MPKRPPKGEHGGTVMPKVNEAELGDDFSYIVRIADTDIDGLKPNNSMDSPRSRELG
jgi:hypothetical protein